MVAKKVCLILGKNCFLAKILVTPHALAKWKRDAFCCMRFSSILITLTKAHQTVGLGATFKIKGLQMYNVNLRIPWGSFKNYVKQ